MDTHTLDLNLLKKLDFTQLIVTALSIVFSGFGLTWFKDYLENKDKKKKEQNKEVLLESLQSINTMYHHMNIIVDNTPVDKVLILVGHDSGNVPNPMNPYYSKVLWQKTKDESNDKHESLIRRFDDVKVDGTYVSMIIQMIIEGCVKIKVSEMPDSFLKRAYIAEGIKYSEVYFLKQEKTDSIYYCSIATVEEDEYFNNPQHRTTIEIAINHIANIFKNIN